MAFISAVVISHVGTDGKPDMFVGVADTVLSACVFQFYGQDSIL